MKSQNKKNDLEYVGDHVNDMFDYLGHSLDVARGIYLMTQSIEVEVREKKYYLSNL